MVNRKTSLKKALGKLYYNDDQRRLAKLVSGFSFDMFIMGVILADAIVLGLMTSPTMEFYFDNGLFLLDRVFMGIFLAEMFLKIVALKSKFFKSGWNIFDLTIVLISSLPFMSAFIILRTLRLFRLFKYINHFSRLNNLVQVFFKVLPDFVSFLVVFIVFFYAFGIIAVSLFGDSFTVFENLGSAIFTLLQIFTLDGWASTIARPIMLVYPDAWVFFATVVLVSFLLIVSFVVSAVVQVVGVIKEK